MDNVSNTVLLRMIEFLQSEIEAAAIRMRQLESINDAQARVIRTMRDDLADSQDHVHRLIQGSEIIVRGLDAVYNHARGMFTEDRMTAIDWEQIYRAMLRADIGFAILNGAPIVDLTAEETEVESQGESGDETETDDEMEAEV